jgi:hypothetical protein
MPAHRGQMSCFLFCCALYRPVCVYGSSLKRCTHLQCWRLYRLYYFPTRSKKQKQWRVYFARWKTRYQSGHKSETTCIFLTFGLRALHVLSLAAALLFQQKYLSTKTAPVLFLAQKVTSTGVANVFYLECADRNVSGVFRTG